MSMNASRTVARLAIVIALHRMEPIAMATTPCDRPTSYQPGMVTASNCVYDVAISNGWGRSYGAYTAGTGGLHPVTDHCSQRETVVLAGGDYLLASFTSLSVRSWTSQTDYLFDLPFHTLPEDNGFTCFNPWQLPPQTLTDIVRDDGQVVGVATHFDASERGDDLAVEVKIVARGESF